MELPNTVFVRRKDVCAVYGITKDDLYTAERAGMLHRVKLPGKKYGRYLRQEIMRVYGKEGECSGNSGKEK